nr:hypothetical protein [Allomuricauda oceani]
MAWNTQSSPTDSTPSFPWSSPGNGWASINGLSTLSSVRTMLYKSTLPVLATVKV